MLYLHILKLNQLEKGKVNCRFSKKAITNEEDIQENSGRKGTKSKFYT